MLKHNYYGNCGQEIFSNLPLVLQRFLSYTQYDTTSDPASTTAPSTEAQMAYAHLLESVGLTDVRVTDKGIVMATLPASVGLEGLPAMGLIAHMDTSPEASGKPAQWKLLDYQGGDIVLNETQNIVMSLERFPGVAKYAGEQLVVTDGTTLLGADDKAGIAICPETPAESIFDILGYCDFIIVMGVHPGFSGQKYIPETTDKLKALRSFIATNKLRTEIEMDGGANESNVAAIAAAGADIIVSGSCAFNSPTPEKVIATFQGRI